MHAPDETCLGVEESLSALLDGELAPAAAAQALEHAFGCPSCRAFFLAAKRLQGAAAELAGRPAGAARPARGSSGLRARFAGVRPGLRAAALVAVGRGGGWALSEALAPGAGGYGARLAEAPMTEQRFVALASELLAAEPKYQRTMLEVLRLVPALEIGEGLDRPEDSRFVRANTEERRAERGAV
jgi:anti-sigma factor RsiW